MARDRRQPRWPAGTPVAPGGKGPGGGRFRDGGGPSGGTGGVGGWLGKISDAIARRRGGGSGPNDGPDPGDPPGHQRFPWESSDEDVRQQRAIRRRYGLPIDADPDETGEAIRYSATGGRVGSPGRSTTLGPQSGRPQIDPTMRVGPGPYDPATPLGRQSSQQPPTPPRPPAGPPPNDGPDPGDPPGHWARRIDDRISHGRFPSDYDLHEGDDGDFESSYDPRVTGGTSPSALRQALDGRITASDLDDLTDEMLEEAVDRLSDDYARLTDYPDSEVTMGRTEWIIDQLVEMLRNQHPSEIWPDLMED